VKQKTCGVAVVKRPHWTPSHIFSVIISQNKAETGMTMEVDAVSGEERDCGQQAHEGHGGKSIFLGS
jgi:hypothetical protein